MAQEQGPPQVFPLSLPLYMGRGGGGSVGAPPNSSFSVHGNFLILDNYLEVSNFICIMVLPCGYY